MLVSVPSVNDIVLQRGYSVTKIAVDCIPKLIQVRYIPEARFCFSDDRIHLVLSEIFAIEVEVDLCDFVVVHSQFLIGFSGAHTIGPLWR